MNIIDLLSQNQIEYWENGKNVSQGYVNIKCPFCDDTSNHLGIRLTDLICNCWKCGPKSIMAVLQSILSMTYSDAKAMIQSLDHRAIIKPKLISRPVSTQLKLPAEATKDFPTKHLQYLTDRGFDAKRTIVKYNLYANGFEGDYRFRIIIPISMDRKIVSFTSRDISGKSKIKYKTATAQESIIDPKQCIFNYDKIKPFQDAILVEGPFDVMKIGDGTFCFLGVKLTQERIQELFKKNINRLFLFYDNDKTGNNVIWRNKNILKKCAKKIIVLKLNNIKDPGELHQDEILDLKRKIEFNY